MPVHDSSLRVPFTGWFHRVFYKKWKQVYVKNKKTMSIMHWLQPSKFTSAVSNCQGFCQGKQGFYSNHLLPPRWLFPSKIYIQFTIFNIYFLAKLSFTNKRYHLHVLEKHLYVLREVRSIIYFWQFIHPLSLHSHGNGTSFAFTSYPCIGEIL